MKGGMVIVAIIAVLVLVVGGWIAGNYNQLVKKSTQVDQAFAEVDNLLQRRNDLIPNLVETVKGYASHERGVFEAVTAARATAAAPGSSPAEQGRQEGLLGQALGRLFAVAEAYPDLKASSSFLQLQAELTETEDRIAAGRRFYNGNVRALNTRVESFPSNIVASTFGFTQAEYFEVTDEAVRAAPTVEFPG